MYNSREPIIVKQSPVVIVKNYLVLQLAAVAAFFLARVLADYGEIYKNLLSSNPVSFHIAEALGVFLFETIVVFYIFFRWYKEYYEIRGDKIIHTKGIFYNRRVVIPLDSIHSLSYEQGPLGKLTRYGEIVLREKNASRDITFDNIPEPQHFVDMIMRLKEKSSRYATVDDVRELIDRDEDDRLEFKSSFRWDHKQSKVNKQLEKATMKTIAAFMNSEGGNLVIGVSDSKNIVGVEHDYRSLPKPNADGFENHFSSVFHQMIGPEYRQFVKLSSHKHNDKEVCLVSVAPSSKPVYLKTEDREEFYIRTGNGTTPLKPSEAASYLDSRK